MISKLIAAIVIIGAAVFIAVGVELSESLKNIKLSEEDVNNSFKDVRK